MRRCACIDILGNTHSRELYWVGSKILAYQLVAGCKTTADASKYRLL
jgi:hypothetical protein